ncbi:two-component response regulator-like APRR5 [Chenopodium quinoa]|uniref:two-component response regulator-like APRR5 n=1 Tax=Chenopodium quinoa TaxID=63459 RepID=UPI000B782F8F|nr:two-component response regulator-like APRR5 [Chenopodium quinoa]
MYCQNNSSFVDHSADFINQNYPSNLSPMLVQSLAGDFDSINEAFMLANANGNTSTGSGCTSSSYIGSPNSPLSCTSSHPPNTTASLMQRSLSSHSLHKNGFYQHDSSPVGLHDLDIGSVRRVFSTGDLDQGVQTLRHHHHHPVGSPLANESTSIIIEGMTKACRYSPEEKKERIERYRSKRNQRNFNKKIQYACRKTLADSRPRIRGRFARNDEIEQPTTFQDLQWNQMAGDEDDEDEGQWIHLLNSLSTNLVP